ncbi:MAG: acetyl-CoA carboxylase biotin carboxyl carrier protein subunit [bacterium]|nr:acetyl-CoA carboxylase biotin carboxyl carrier protein subunit [bacterium]
MEEVFSYKDKIFNVSVDNSDKGQKININENSSEISVLSQDENEVVIDLDGERSKYYIASDKDNYYVFYNGRQHLFTKQSAGADRAAGMPGAAAGDFISSPMPGTIIKINCREGDDVKENDTLVIVEAMKMENNLRAPADGKIEKINFSEGDLVDAGAPIVEIET